MSNAVKDDFLGLVSHELRTPVTTIFGNARLLRDRGERLGDAERQSMITDLAGESERLLGIIENLLTLTRVEAGVQVDLEPQVLSHVVRKSIESYRGRHPSRAIGLSVEPHYIIVEADRAHLEIILENLLSNADKYSPRELPVEVVVRSAGEEAHVIVRDRGIGLEESDAEQLFTPFYRSETARARATGIGIGLTVCRRLVQLHGGRMWARRRVGGGSEFGVALPLAPDPGAAA
ncbi:MAG: ATP-binding protein [Chloroflexota bacterium]|nr:ATP-binding protein [Chloroflexota bacterium]